MDLTRISSVTAYTGSLKATAAVRGAIEAGGVGNRSDTAAFSARAHAAAKQSRKESFEHTKDRAAGLPEKTAVTETAEKFAKDTDNSVKPCGQSELSREIERGINELKEAAEKIAAENAQKHVQSTAKAPVEASENTIVQGVDRVKDKDGKSVAEMVREQIEKLDSLLAQREYDKANDNRLGSIKAKMRTGGTLTPAEQQYLAAKDPDGYSVFQQIESSRKMYRCSLSACRTRDEVNSMRLSNALSALSAYRKAVRNGGDGSAVAGLNAALDNEIRSFMGTSEYRRLPTVAECNKFDRDLAKAKRNEREKKLAEKRRQEAKRKKTLAARKLAAKRAKYKKTPGDGKLTVAQVMSSPTAKKVLASRAKRTYCGCAYINDFKGTSKLYSKA